MIVEILESSFSADGPLSYNERKVIKGQSVICASRGLEYEGFIPVKRMLERYTKNPRINAKAKNLIFHAAFNPSEEDTGNESMLVAFVNEYLDRIQYGNQPYVLYRHDDIARSHYHLLAPSVSEEGKVIRDNFEGGNWNYIVTKKIVAEIGPKYGFFPAKEKKKALATVIEQNPELHPDRSVEKKCTFSPTARHQTDNLRFLFRTALSYNFTTREEFRSILRTMNLTWPDRAGMEEVVRLQGMTPEGVKTTKVLPFERKMEPCAYRLFLQRQQQHIEEEAVAVRTENTPSFDRDDMLRRCALAAAVRICTRESDSADRFQLMMKELGYETLIHRRDGKEFTAGQIYASPIEGMTVIDTVNRRIYPAGKSAHVFDTSELARREDNGAWLFYKTEIKEKGPFITPEMKTMIQAETERSYNAFVQQVSRNTEKQRAGEHVKNTQINNPKL